MQSPLSQLLENLKSYWVFLVFITGMIGTWLTFQYKLEAHEGRLDRLESLRENELELLNSIRLDVELTKRDVQYIKAQLQ